jgi:hypothetical protein
MDAEAPSFGIGTTPGLPWVSLGAMCPQVHTKPFLIQLHHPPFELCWVCGCFHCILSGRALYSFERACDTLPENIVSSSWTRPGLPACSSASPPTHLPDCLHACLPTCPSVQHARPPTHPPARPPTHPLPSRLPAFPAPLPARRSRCGRWPSWWPPRRWWGWWGTC